MAALTFTGFVTAIANLAAQHMAPQPSLLAKICERLPARGVDGTAEVDPLEVIDLALLAEDILEPIGLHNRLLDRGNDLWKVHRVGELYLLVCRLNHIVPDFSRDE